MDVVFICVVETVYAGFKKIHNFTLTSSTNRLDELHCLDELTSLNLNHSLLLHVWQIEKETVPLMVVGWIACVTERQGPGTG